MSRRFYKGKALHSRQGNLKIVAMPEFVKNGKRTAPKIWFMNGQTG